MTLDFIKDTYPEEYEKFMAWFVSNYNLWNVPGDTIPLKVNFLHTLPPEMFYWSLMTYFHKEEQERADKEFSKYIKAKFDA